MNSSVDHRKTSRLVQWFGGVPFTDRDFRPNSLISAVVASRAFKRGVDPKDVGLAALFDPGNERQWRLEQQPDTPVIPSQPLDQEHLGRVDSAVSFITSRLPGWTPLWSPPFLFKLLTTPGSMSASSFGYPQQVFLSADAFTTDRELREQVIHETAHNWMYMVAEILPLSRGDASTHPRFILPSGTGGKLPSEVLGALHVTQSLRTYYEVGKSESDQERLNDLLTYIEGCQGLLDEVGPYLSETGEEILWRLTRV